ncbi:MAG: ATP-binding cassette domain-containing protein [Pseudodesulfovibrio sp.]|uniref:ABC transporter related protein n=1 Tax=Pseudodesulfovibrio aespoeensis (strain ATCC 700646 / DSM 10631 / Aspo-2) TaxID=643562 RepID=E6VW25_PSEA9|nr:MULTISPECIES: ATP-binding cassette domain-containing protein [Pseudodesulfovibrio]MBU4378316.1 ATP-binding cassette domain-containing protein [Pseudomonadota bacterium]ADU62470.1 ABC transporter related protein [Pseudodesulfovibrio aespoeensis Aspo-2]MBU4475287.1 ATP-binding cassette domain-containing protein [Pseudomonadota bacterium]MBU4515063.1 ATP-binding cassette domain-containing protein [Pseudomonadota bacterium]MBU4520968.1 ATP-binding cassette domain-containing protein [Pseudomonad
MNELFRRLFRSKPLAVQIIVASFFVNVLFLASPIFVIQILSRYVGYGFDGTLYTLTAGMIIALVLGLAFSMIRTRMCATLSAEPDRLMQAAVLDSLSRIKAVAFERIPQARIQEVMAGPQVVQSAYESAHIAAVLDMPFFLLFLLAITALSPWLGLITLLAAVTTVLAGRMNMLRARDTDNALREELIRHRGGVNSAIQGAETVRAFHAAGFLGRLWTEQVERLMALRELAVNQKSWAMAVVQGLNSLLRVLIYAVGAKLVVSGDLTVGSLIGISILSAKALQISTGFMQSVQLMGKAEDTMRMIGEFMSLPRESAGGTAIKRFTGRIEFRDVAIAFPGATGPLFESLNHGVEPGTVVGIFGANGAGKTTLSKLVAGLLEPSRGQILADGVDLRQLAPEWWRRQVMYLPQEPTFLNGTYRENITLLNPDMEDAQLNDIVRRADLRRFLDSTATGLDTPITEGGRSLPLGVRKRLAIARALVAQGRLAVFDEPTEGLDVEGCEAVFQVMNHLAKDGVTLIIVSRDPNIVKGYTTIIDLNSKPVPKIGLVQKKPVAPDQATAMKS